MTVSTPWLWYLRHRWKAYSCSTCCFVFFPWMVLLFSLLSNSPSWCSVKPSYRAQERAQSMASKAPLEVPRLLPLLALSLSLVVIRASRKFIPLIEYNIFASGDQMRESPQSHCRSQRLIQGPADANTSLTPRTDHYHPMKVQPYDKFNWFSITFAYYRRTQIETNAKNGRKFVKL